MDKKESSRPTGPGDTSITEETPYKLIDASHDSISLLDTEGKILHINLAGAAQLGGSPDKLMGQCIYDLFSSEVARSRKTKIDKVVKTGEPATFDDILNGIHFTSNVYAIPNEEGIVTKVAIFATDITERRQAETILEQSRGFLNCVINSIADPVAACLSLSC